MSTPLSVAALRRSSPHQHPLRLGEYEALQRRANATTPTRISSNGRARSSPRYESPLDPSALRRASIRPMAGAAVGTVAATTTRIQETEPRPRSYKQGPSHRKMRRWNNDHFDKLASEISTIKGGSNAATSLLQAKQNAHLYKSILLSHNDSNNAKLINDFFTLEQYKELRRQFFDGSMPIETRREKVKGNNNKNTTTQLDYLKRIDGRLRAVVFKACRRSDTVTSQISAFENYLLLHNSNNDWWKQHDIQLLENPIVENNRIQFHFDAESSTGGFHRLLLHAVAQFHGLVAVSKSIKLDNGTFAKGLIVKGKMMQASPKYKLTDIVKNDAQ